MMLKTLAIIIVAGVALYLVMSVCLAAQHRVTGVSVQATPVLSSYQSYVTLARADAQIAGISPDIFVRQMYEESGMNPNVVSPAGAIGIAQFMPTTAQGLGIDPHNPVQSLQGAAQLMRRYLDRYGWDYAKALACYNAGCGALNIALARGGPQWKNYLPAETQRYIQVILGG